MLDVIDQIRDLSQKGTHFAVCTVIKTWRSSPRPVGSCLLVTEAGEMHGSVSGGCVENAVVGKALKVLKSDQPAIATYGVTDEEAWEIGLSCGGAIEVFIAPFFGKEAPNVWEAIDKGIQENRGTALIQSLEDGGVALLGGDERFSLAIHDQSSDMLDRRVNGKTEDDLVFVQSFPTKAKMILIGSAHISVELIELANLYGFETIVIDPRETFSKKTGYRVEPSQILTNWPGKE